VKSKRVFVEQIAAGPAAGRNRDSGQPGVPKGRDFRPNILLVEEGLRRPAVERNLELQQFRDDDTKLRRVVAGLTVDKVMLP
jgi:hypothetical protein